MGEYEHLKPGVRESLPEVDQISDPDLRERVVAAWAMALSETEFTSIEDPPSGNPDSPALKRGTQADHLRGVARIALAMADSLESIVGSIGFDRDLLLASALCHDIGKPFEFSHENRKRWSANPKASGFPACAIPCTALTSRSRRGCRKRCVTRRADIRARVN